MSTNGHNGNLFGHNLVQLKDTLDKDDAFYLHNSTQLAIQRRFYKLQLQLQNIFTLLLLTLFLLGLF